MGQKLKDTLNLPKTAFPMRAGLAEREPKRLEHWEKSDLYGTVQRKNEGGPEYILHDGPPYANGHIHLGHALNKILKDIILRYKSMRGYRTPYIPGWDCHGLPIEQQILKKLGPKIHEMEPSEVRKLCEEYAKGFVDIQREEFKRLGILGDWDKPYLTFDPTYEAGILSTLRDLVANGLVRKGLRVVHWDPVFRTALAEAEIEYHDHTSHSIYVGFPLRDSEKYAPLEGLKNVSVVIWTTTPWTLPANLGISLHPKYEYVALEHDGRTSIVAADLAESFLKACEIEGAKEVARFKAGYIDRAECDHPIFPDKSSLVMLGEHVTLEQGTGCVHTAPGHGAEDFAIGNQYGLPVFVPVDDRGRYNELYPEMQGESVFDCNDKIVEKVRAAGILLGHGKVRHEYPHSWRSKKPILFRATEQWFMELEEPGRNVREAALEAIDEDVHWIPAWGRARIRGMVENRPDWCLSRQRSWGVPIPSIRSKKSGESILDARILDKFIQRVRETGTNCWYDEPLENFLPEGFTWEATGESSPEDFEKEFDILDVWFDSGASHIACLEQDERVHSPADLYVEGSDQHRGWFQAALLTSIGARERAPYKAVLTHGFLLDGEGRAMSKSMGNVIAPQKVIKNIGADNLRLWVTSVDYLNDARVSDEILKRITETYRLLRISLRYQLSNLFDFDPQKDLVAPSELSLVDAWALNETAALIAPVTEAYESCEFHKVYQLLNRFCSVTLSAQYHDIIKDRLYTFGAASKERRSAQTVLYHLFNTLNRLLAPVLVFTADEAWSFAQGEEYAGEGSVHLESWPEADDAWFNADAAAAMKSLLGCREQVNDKLESLRQDKIIGKSLEAEITLTGKSDDPLFKTLSQHAAVLPELFIVSSVTLEEDASAGAVLVEARPSQGTSCPRCWRRVETLQTTPIGETCPRCAMAIS